jgi:inhibitor of the pro-sigma K processing machinery
MDLNQKVIAALLAGFFLIALLRVFQAPLKVAVKLLANKRNIMVLLDFLTAALLLGFLALWAVNLTSGITGLTLGLNLWNALVIGILGLPGFGLLLLVHWVL